MNKLLSLFAALVISNSANAVPIVIDFESGWINTDGIYESVNAFNVKNGFKLSVNNPDSAQIGPAVPIGFIKNNTSVYSFCGINPMWCGSGTFLTLTGSSPFSVSSLSASYWDFGEANGTIELIGTLADGGQVRRSLWLSSNWLDYELSGFNNLSSLYMAGQNLMVGASIDNIVVTYAAAVPEPTTYAMLLAGLGMLGFQARRRTA